VFTNANASVHQLGQGMPQSDLHPMLFNLDDMHCPTLKMEDFLYIFMMVEQVMRMK
jgi:hypothetical protein